MAKKINPANILLEKHLQELGLEFEREFKFHSERKWKADYRLKAVIAHGLEVLIEIEGQVYLQGRHTRGAGYEKDCLKYNHAAMAGYLVLRFSTGQVLRGIAKAFIAEHIC